MILMSSTNTKGTLFPTTFKASLTCKRINKMPGTLLWIRYYLLAWGGRWNHLPASLEYLRKDTTWALTAWGGWSHRTSCCSSAYGRILYERLCYIQIDYYHRRSGVGSLCDCILATIRTRSARLFLEKTMLTDVNRFVAHKICCKLLCNEAPHDPR